MTSEIVGVSEVEGSIIGYSYSEKICIGTGLIYVLPHFQEISRVCMIYYFKHHFLSNFYFFYFCQKLLHIHR